MTSRYNFLKLLNKARLLNSKSIYLNSQLRLLTSINNIILKPINLNQPKLSINSAKNYTNKSESFQYISNETLESLTEKFDRLVDEFPSLFTDDYDVTYSNNVLTIRLGPDKGTYVLNTQTPNSQIWLSSPVSGPYRYDFIDNKWVYKHTGETLHELLSKEFSEIYYSNIDFSKCSFAGCGDKSKSGVDAS
jgi:frataxin